MKTIKIHFVVNGIDQFLVVINTFMWIFWGDTHCLENAFALLTVLKHTVKPFSKKIIFTSLMLNEHFSRFKVCYGYKEQLIIKLE